MGGFLYSVFFQYVPGGCGEGLVEVFAVVVFEGALQELPKEDSLRLAVYYRDKILSRMEALRSDLDEMELLTSADYWPLPTYGELLFSVK